MNYLRLNVKAISLILISLSLLLLVQSGQAQVNPADHHRKQQQEIMQDQGLAFEYFRNKEYEKAALYFEKLFDKTQAESYYTYFLNCLAELHQYDKAEKLIRRQLKSHPNHYKYNIDLGYIYTLQGKEQKAARQYNKVFDKLPANQVIISRIATAFLYRKQTDLAIQALEAGEKIMGNPLLFKMDLANIYYSTGEFSNMIDAYLDYISFDYGAKARILNRLQLIINTGTGDEIREILKSKLLYRTQQNPDIKVFPEMLLWLSVQQKDFEFALTQAKAIDRRFEKTGKQVFELAQLSASNQQYDIAIQAYDFVIKHAIENSYFLLKSKIGLLNAQFEKLKNTPDFSIREINKINKAYDDVLDDLGRSAETILLIKNKAHLLAFYLNELDDAAKLLESAIQITEASETDIAWCKLELADIRLFKGEVWEATLLYSQVEKDFKHDPIGHEAKFRNARLFYYIGEFEWARMKLDILKAATSKLIANDAMELSLLISDNTNMDSTTAELSIYAQADLLVYRNKKDLAIRKLDSLFETYAYHPVFDEALYKLAEISAGKGNYQKADSLFEKIGTQYPFDILGDDALIQRARIHEHHLNDYQKAMELYQQLLVDYPGSVFTVEARKRFRTLRGDLVN